MKVLTNILVSTMFLVVIIIMMVNFSKIEDTNILNNVQSLHDLGFDLVETFDINSKLYIKSELYKKDQKILLVLFRQDGKKEIKKLGNL